MGRTLTNVLHVINYQQIIHMFGELVSNRHMCEEFVAFLKLYEEMVHIFQTSEMINLRNLSTNFRPQNLLKLTIRTRKFTFGICDVLVPIFLVKIYKMKDLRFSRAPIYCEIYINS